MTDDDPMRIDYADVLTALREVLKRKPADRQFAQVWEVKDFIWDKWGVEETSAWIAARLKERAKLKGDVRHCLLYGKRGALYGGWEIVTSPSVGKDSP